MISLRPKGLGTSTQFFNIVEFKCVGDFDKEGKVKESIRPSLRIVYSC